MGTAWFKKKVWGYYKKSGRHNLPWRHTRDPYKILISEVMLQQTQVDRVIPYYKKFLALFPTPRALAKATPADVLRAWQGLGYNRRALYLHRSAQLIRSSASYQLKLPGVGAYTRSAIRVFAWNKPEVMLETNIRTVFLHHFFPHSSEIHDREILAIIEKTMDTQNPREWYWALMDYGAHVKKTNPNPSRKSKHHTHQSPFRGSRREIRGKILKNLLLAPRPKKTIFELFPKERKNEVEKVLVDLGREGFLRKRKNTISLI